MYLSFQIPAADAAAFVSHWSAKYGYPHDKKYTNNIGKPLTRKSLNELFEWKNGTGNHIAQGKLDSIARNYPLKFKGNVRKRYLDHRQSGGAIWNIFYLHCTDPEAWPIFDQNTFRAMRYLETGRIQEIGSKSEQKYLAYTVEYIPFFTKLALATKTANQRTIDKALFAFGQFLRTAARYA